MRLEGCRKYAAAALTSMGLGAVLLAAALTGTCAMDSPSRLRRPNISLFSQFAAALASTPLASSSLMSTLVTDIPVSLPLSSVRNMPLSLSRKLLPAIILM